MAEEESIAVLTPVIPLPTALYDSNGLLFEFQSFQFLRQPGSFSYLRKDRAQRPERSKAGRPMLSVNLKRHCPSIRLFKLPRKR